MKKYSYEQINEYVQWLMNMMDTEYPNNYELVIDRECAKIRSNQPELIFIKEGLKMGMNNKRDMSSLFNKNGQKEVAKE